MTTPTDPPSDREWLVDFVKKFHKAPSPERFRVFNVAADRNCPTFGSRTGAIVTYRDTEGLRLIGRPFGYPIRDWLICVGDRSTITKSYVRPLIPLDAIIRIEALAPSSMPTDPHPKILWQHPDYDLLHAIAALQAENRPPQSRFEKAMRGQFLDAFRGLFKTGPT